MNYFDPRKSYFSHDNRGVMVKPVVEMSLLQQEQIMERNPEIGEILHLVVATPTTSQLRWLLENMPDIFGNADPQDPSTMDESGLAEHTRLIENLKDPESHESKFAEWVDKRRSES